MKPFWLYRVAAVLLLLFSAGHTVGFRKTKPEWGIDAIVNAMKTTSFYVNGFPRTYWDFYVGFGLFVSLLLLFAALVCWQLGGLNMAALKSMPFLTWSLVICFVGVTYLSWRYFFIPPLVFSIAITVVLGLAAWSIRAAS